MPDSMVDRVKSAIIAEAQLQVSEGGPEHAGGIDYGTMESVNGRACLIGEFHIERIVRAILAAMREPTEAMIRAGRLHTDSYYGDEDDFRHGWAAAIEAALAEEG